MPIKLNSTGGGSVTLDVPSMTTANTLVLPAKSGNIITSADSGTVTQTMLGTGLAGNGPAFSAIRQGGAGSNVSLPSATWTKIPFNGTDFDSNSVVNTSTGTITPTVAGYYNIMAAAYINYSSSAMNRMGLRIYKNGSAFKGDATTGTTAYYGMITLGCLVYCNGSTDYLELYAYQQSSTDAVVLASGVYTFMSGFLARAA